MLGLEGLEFGIQEPSCKERVRLWLRPSCPALNGIAPKKTWCHGAYPVPKGPRVVRWGPHGHVVGFCSFYNHRGKPGIIHS
jgi:hypothetical protein